jgi:hypothetical protein
MLFETVGPNDRLKISRSVIWRFHNFYARDRDAKVKVTNNMAVSNIPNKFNDDSLTSLKAAISSDRPFKMGRKIILNLRHNCL